MILDAPTLLRTIGRGSRTELDALSRWTAALASPVLRGRRLGIASAESGVGTSTIASQLARALAPSRTVLAVDVAATASHPGLGRALGAAETPPDRSRQNAASAADARTGLSRAGGVDVLWPAPTADPIDAWLTHAAPIARFFDAAVTDFGRLDPRSSLPEAAALSDVLCLVAGADRASAELALSFARGVRGLPERPTGILVLVDRDGRHAVAARALAGAATVPTIVIPRDTGLARRSSASRVETRLRLVQLAATLVSKGDAA